MAGGNGKVVASFNALSHIPGLSDKSMQQHRALAEASFRLGNIRTAIEQLLLAQKAGDGDFYLQSSVDARLRELRTLDGDGKKDGRK